ncbi:MAG TPA: hypothetical protein VFW44_19265 [Bryobacteraceae bacterium]|nr:hypothetical protein [Bryobacteraceae bacterium]
MNRSILALKLLVSILAAAAVVSGQPADRYTAVEVDPFAVNKAVALPAGYPSALAESIARELSVEFPTILILRQGEPAPDRQRILRVSGTVLQFKAPNPAKKLLTGFGGGAAVAAGVRFEDVATKRVVKIQEFQAAPDSLGKKIAKFCTSERLFEAK